MILEDNLRVSKLIDTYGVLLTDKQYKIMTNYYFDNLTLSEIGDNLKISRQAVNDCLTQSNRILENYEDKLHIVNKQNIINSKLNELKLKSTQDNLTNLIEEIIDINE